MEQWKLAAVVGMVALGGVAVGALCFGSPRAEAQSTARYSRCIVARQESLDTNGSGQVEGLDAAHTITIPEGWTVVGGSGVTGATHYLGGVVLCR